MTNVAVVVLDTLRYDAFAEAFDWLEGARFTRAYSTAHWTIPAHASLFTGQYASEVGVHGRSPSLDCPHRTLAEAFADAGYRTRCLTANTQQTQYEGWDRGFDEFAGPANLRRVDDGLFDWGRHIETTERGPKRYVAGVWNCLADDCDTLRSLKHGYDLFSDPKWTGGATDVRDRLRATDFGDDEFLFVNLMDAHTPYRPPEGETGCPRHCATRRARRERRSASSHGPRSSDPAALTRRSPVSSGTAAFSFAIPGVCGWVQPRALWR